MIFTCCQLLLLLVFVILSKHLMNESVTVMLLMNDIISSWSVFSLTIMSVMYNCPSCIFRLQSLSSCPDSLPSVQCWAPVQPSHSGLSVQSVCAFCRCDLVVCWESSEQWDLYQHRCSATRPDFPNQQLSVHPDVRLEHG